MSLTSGIVASDWAAVLDSSALLAWLLQEPGGETVEAYLPGLISTVNLTEVIIVAVRKGLPIEGVQRVLSELPISIVSFDEEQTFPTALLHAQTRQSGLSLADCVCVNLGASLRLPVVTAETRWGQASLPTEVKLIR